MKICAYGICKNEIQSIKNLFNSAIQQADYICFLDTGSTDGTWEWLQEQKKLQPNKIFIAQKEIKPWAFDDARNDSLLLIPKDTDVCVSVDADDIPVDDWRTIVEENINQGYNGIIGQYFYYDPQTHAKVTAVTNLDRVALYDRFYWQGVIHERIIRDEPNLKYDPRFIFNHMQKDENKEAFYLNCAKYAVARDNNPYDLLCLGYAYWNNQQWENCINTFTLLSTWLSDKSQEFLTRKMYKVLAEAYLKVNQPVLAVSTLQKALNTHNENSPYEDTINYSTTIITDRLNEIQNLLPNEYRFGVYAICKNEEKHVNKWLESYKDADLIIIVDTGSTDSTPQLLQDALQHYPQLRIYHHIIQPFSFGDAKEFALSKLREETNSKQWIYACFDLDEFLEPNSIPIIKQQWQPQFDNIRIKVDVVNSNHWWCEVNHKIHSSSPNWHWHRPIHEELILDNVQQYNEEVINISYQHIQDLKKDRNYFEMLLRDHAERPDDVTTVSYLVAEYYNNLHDLDEARKWLALYDKLVEKGNNIDKLWDYQWHYLLEENTDKKCYYCQLIINNMEHTGQYFRYPYVQYAGLLDIHENKKEELLLKALSLKQIHGNDTSDLALYIELLNYYYYNNQFLLALSYAEVALAIQKDELNKSNYDYCKDTYINYLKNKIYKSNKIAVYAITKNEIKFLDKWFESMKEADYICVLDTGSTDGTWEKLQQYAQINPGRFIIKKQIFYNWRFDLPRNIAMSLIPEDANILLSTDLDEILESNWAEELRLKWNKNIERGEYTYIWSHTNTGQPGRVFMYNKLHNWYWLWRYPVHELLYDIRTNSEHYSSRVVLDKMFLHHWPDQTKSRSSYLPLLIQRKQEAEDDYYGLIYLCHEYYYQGQYENSIKELYNALEKSTDRQDTLTIASCYLFLGDDYAAIRKPPMHTLKQLKQTQHTENHTLALPKFIWIKAVMKPQLIFCYKHYIKLIDIIAG